MPAVSDFEPFEPAGGRIDPMKGHHLMDREHRDPSPRGGAEMRPKKVEK